MKKFFTVIFCTMLFSCQSINNANQDDATSGSVKITVDESFRPLMSSVVDTFMGLYINAHISASYKPEADCFADLLNDSVRLVVSTRDLTAGEKKYFESRKLYPSLTKIAIDAVALIVNNDNDDSLTTDQLRKIIDGTYTDWKEVFPTSKLGKITVVFDQKKSCNTRYLKETFLGAKDFPSNIFAANSNPDVINYVSKNKQALGVIGVNWISDHDDKQTVGFLDKIKVIRLSPPDSSGYSQNYYEPYQAYIALKQYALTRDVYIVNREARAGLGTGFASFVAGDQGQRLVRLSGLLPATMPVRIINNK